MTRCWNTDEFQQALANVFRAAGRVRAVLEQTIAHPPDEQEKNAMQERIRFWLECHARDFLIDHILASLNWQLQPSIDAGEYISANLVTEQSPDGVPSSQYKSEVPEHSRRLDYLGYARDSDRPLLVVEAKRPSIALPGANAPLAPPTGHPIARVLSIALNSMREGSQLPRRSLNSQWKDSIEQLRDYCRGVARTRGDWPARAVLTNGEWLILFSDPQNAFTESPQSAIDEHRILVFESNDRLVEHHKLLWEQLEYASLAKGDRRIQLTQLPFIADPASIESCSYGLRISYTYKSTNYRRAPLLSVSPLLFVRSSGVSFIQVVSDWDQEIPADGRETIAQHIREVESECSDLKAQLEQRVLGGRILPLISVSDHSNDREAIRARPLVQPLPHPDGQTFLVLTGTSPHFVMDTTRYAGCEYHHHSAARRMRVAQRGEPILESTIDPKSYFIDGEIRHCAHKQVHEIKREPITQANNERCGHRSSAIGNAFCEVWRFEEYLCCRACVFNPVCELAQVYSLPCRAMFST